MTIPPWLQPADDAGNYARGIQIGSSIGEAQARQRLSEQQQAFQEQQAAVQQARADAEFQLRSQAQARRYAATQKYQQLLASGMDPAQALLQVAPDMGESLTGAAQLARQANPHTKAIAPPQVRFADVGGKKVPYLVDMQTGRGSWAPSGALGASGADGITPLNLGPGQYLMGNKRFTVPQPKLSRDDLIDDEAAKSELQAIHHQKASPSTDPADIPALEKREKQLIALRKGIGKPPSAPATTAAQEVTRLTKDGRKAVFDAATKKFLRWADAPATPDAPSIPVPGALPAAAAPPAPATPSTAEPDDDADE